MALLLAAPMRAFYLATRPVVDLFNALGNLVLNPFGIPPASEAGHAPHSEDELRELLRESREGGLIEREEQQLSEAALVFGDRRAREVMTPRAEIDFASTADAPREIAEKAMSGGHTRRLVLLSSLDLFALATVPTGPDEAEGPPPQVLRATGQPRVRRLGGVAGDERLAAGARGGRRSAALVSAAR
jgi:hypothetical protein